MDSKDWGYILDIVSLGILVSFTGLGIKQFLFGNQYVVMEFISLFMTAVSAFVILSFYIGFRIGTDKPKRKRRRR